MKKMWGKWTKDDGLRTRGNVWCFYKSVGFPFTASLITKWNKCLMGGRGVSPNQVLWWIQDHHSRTWCCSHYYDIQWSIRNRKINITKSRSIQEFDYCLHIDIRQSHETDMALIMSFVFLSVYCKSISSTCPFFRLYWVGLTRLRQAKCSSKHLYLPLQNLSEPLCVGCLNCTFDIFLFFL